MTYFELMAAIAFFLLLAALLATGLVLARRPEPRSRDETMAPEARATDAAIAEEIKKGARDE